MLHDKSISDGASIPKVIHQTFPTKAVPAEIRENIANTKAMNPGWEFRFYDDADVVDFIKSNYEPAIFDHFERINPLYGAARADLFRYLLMYQYGGVYLDAKSALTRPLDATLRPGDRYLLSHWRNGKGEMFEGTGLHPALQKIPRGEFQQWHIVAAAKHPFLEAVIKNVLRNIDRYNPGLHDAGQYGVLRLTGPIAYTLAIAPIVHLHPHRFVDSESDLGFQYSIFSKGKHKEIFAQHYTDLESPIVRIGINRKVSAVAFSALRKAYRFVRQSTRAASRNRDDR